MSVFYKMTSIAVTAVARWRQIDLSWPKVTSSTQQDAQWYGIYYKIQGQSTIYAQEVTHNVNVANITASIVNLTDNTTYELYVNAYDLNNKVIRASSNQFVTIAADTGFPLALETVAVTPIQYGGIVTWIKRAQFVASGISHYNIAVTPAVGAAFVEEVAADAAASCTLTNLNPAIAYSVAVAPVSRAGAIGVYVPANQTLVPMIGVDTVSPGRVNRVLAIPGGPNGSVLLSWAATYDPTGNGITGTGVLGYQIRYGIRVSGVETEINTLTGLTSPQTFPSLLNGVEYWFQVRSYDAALATGAGVNNVGEWSKKSYVTPFYLAPDSQNPFTPTFLATSGNGAIKIAFGPNNDFYSAGFAMSGVTSYEINTVGDFGNPLSYSWTPSAIFDADKLGTSLNIPNAANGFFNVQIRAVDGAGNKSAWTVNQLSASATPGSGVFLGNTVTSDTLAPSKIMNMLIKERNNSLYITFGPSYDPTDINQYWSGNVIYEYQYRVANTTIWSPETRTYGGSRIVDIGGLTNNVTYELRARGIDNSGNGNIGVWSEVFTATPSDPPAPTDLDLFIDGRNAKLMWTPVTTADFYDAEGYYISVERRATSTGPVLYTYTEYTITSAATDMYDTIILPGYHYTFKIATRSVRNGATRSTYATIADDAPILIDTTAPSAPVVTLTPGDTTISAEWTSSTDSAHPDGGESISGLSGYELQYQAAIPIGPIYTSFGLLATTPRVKLLSSLVNGTPYNVRVRAIDVSGNKSAWSTVKTTTPRTSDFTAPVPVKTATVTPGHRSLSVTWSDTVDPVNAPEGTQSGVASYTVYCQDVNATLTSPLILPGATKSYTFTGLTANALYNIYFKTVDVSGNISYSKDFEGVPIFGDDTVPPSVPTNVVASAGNGSVSLAWDPSTDPSATSAASGIAHYRVQYKLTPAGSYTLSPTLFPSNDATISSLTNGSEYMFQVKAVDLSNNESNWSADTSFSKATPIGPDVTPPSVPTLQAPVAGNASISLSWSAATDANIVGAALSGLKGYKLQWRIGVASYVESPILYTGLSTTIPGLINGSTYDIQISSIDNANNQSGWSTAVSATPKAPDTTKPPAPSGLTATAGDALVDLSWNAVVDTPSTTQLVSGTPVYNIRYKLTGSPDASYNIVGTYSTTSAQIGSLVNNSSYDFQVRAADASGNQSDWSSPAVSATPTAPVAGDGGAVGGGGGAVGIGSTAPICFLARAPVLTPSGYRAICTLRIGDRVRTADGRTATIKRTLRNEYTTSASVNPYVIPKGVYGAISDLAISPNHEVQTKDGMVKAKNLGLNQMEMAGSFVYYNIEVDDWATDNLVVAGVEVESLAPIERVAIPAAAFTALMKERYAKNEVAMKRAMSLCFAKNGSVMVPPCMKAAKAKASKSSA